MPNVNGKKFPYTPAGMAAAKKAAGRASAAKRPGGSLVKKPGGTKPAVSKRSKTEFISVPKRGLVKPSASKSPGKTTRPAIQRKPRPMNNRRGM